MVLAVGGAQFVGYVFCGHRTYSSVSLHAVFTRGES